MKRRDFVWAVVGGVGAVSVAAYFLFDDVEYDPAIAQPRALSLILDDKGIQAIGEQYRKQVPDESSANTLAKILKGAGSDVEDKIANDFKTGNTVIVDGWILSVTEARQCALSSTRQKS